MLHNINIQHHLPTQALSEIFNFLIDQNSVRNRFYTFKLFVLKCPNYGRGRVRTKSEHTNFLPPFQPMSKISNFCHGFPQYSSILSLLKIKKFSIWPEIQQHKCSTMFSQTPLKYHVLLNTLWYHFFLDICRIMFCQTPCITMLFCQTPCSIIFS